MSMSRFLLIALALALAQPSEGFVPGTGASTRSFRGSGKLRSISPDRVREAAYASPGPPPAPGTRIEQSRERRAGSGEGRQEGRQLQGGGHSKDQNNMLRVASSAPECHPLRDHLRVERLVDEFQLRPADLLQMTEEQCQTTLRENEFPLLVVFTLQRRLREAYLGPHLGPPPPAGNG